MIIWNLNKWYDKFLTTHSEEELKELFAWSLRRREYLIEKENAPLLDDWKQFQ